MVTECELEIAKRERNLLPNINSKAALYPYPFRTAFEMLEMGNFSCLGIAEMKRANDLIHLSSVELNIKLLNIWSTMKACMDRGLEMQGSLPGGLNVK